MTLAPHRLARQVTKHPLPPSGPFEPPLADRAPDMLIAFIYYMTRDLIPPRYTENVLAHVRANPKLGADDLWRYAEGIARQLAYEEPEVQP